MSLTPGGAPVGTTADDPVLLQEQRLSYNGADIAGPSELGSGDAQLNREEQQVTHRRGGLPDVPVGTKLLIYCGSRYNWQIRTPPVVPATRRCFQSVKR